MDRVAPEVRSRIMSRIRGSGTGPEVALAGALAAAGVDFHPNDRSLPGSPDFAVGSARLAVFVHGCFWHGCPRHYRLPKSNVEFWERKVRGNRRRDARARRALNRAGWSVMVVWEHDVRSDPGRVAARVAGRARCA